MSWAHRARRSLEDQAIGALFPGGNAAAGVKPICKETILVLETNPFTNRKELTLNPDNYTALLRHIVRHKLLLFTASCIAMLALSQIALGVPTVPGAGQADLTVAKSGDETAPRGGIITYSVVVGNGGPDSAVNVVLTDAIPAHTTYVNAVPSQGTVMFDGTSVTASLGSIAAFESASVTLTVSVNNDTPRGTIISNTASVTSDTSDPEMSDNTGTAQTAVSGAFSGDLVISEFRLRGPAPLLNGKEPGPAEQNEFIEIYNNSNADHVVTSSSGTGYGIVASDGVLRCTIPNNTVLRRNAHYLCVNSNGYSLNGYPAGEFATATGDATYSQDIPDNAGIALFNNNSGDYTLFARLDAVGSTSEANTLYKEGTGYPALTPFNIDYSFYRDNCGRQGAVDSLVPCTITTGVIDTDNNASDFIFVDTNGTSAGAGQRLGAPGPENLSSPIERNGQYIVTYLDPCAELTAAPNQVRDLNSDPPNNSTFGTIEIRRTITNNSVAPATRLRFRVTQQTTFPAPSGIADLRLRSSGDTEVTVDRAPCGMDTSDITVHGTTLEQPPNQPNGGGFNSTVSAISPVGQGAAPRRNIDGLLELSTPLNPGESIDLRFLYGVQQTGKFRVTLNIEVVEAAPLEEGRTGSKRAKGLKTTVLQTPTVLKSPTILKTPAIHETPTVLQAPAILRNPAVKPAPRMLTTPLVLRMPIVLRVSSAPTPATVRKKKAARKTRKILRAKQKSNAQ